MKKVGVEKMRGVKDEAIEKNASSPASKLIIRTCVH